MNPQEMYAAKAREFAARAEQLRASDFESLARGDLAVAEEMANEGKSMLRRTADAILAVSAARLTAAATVATAATTAITNAQLATQTDGAAASKESATHTLVDADESSAAVGASDVGAELSSPPVPQAPARRSRKLPRRPGSANDDAECDGSGGGMMAMNNNMLQPELDAKTLLTDDATDSDREVIRQMFNRLYTRRIVPVTLDQLRAHSKMSAEARADWIEGFGPGTNWRAVCHRERSAAEKLYRRAVIQRDEIAILRTQFNRVVPPAPPANPTAPPPDHSNPAAPPPDKSLPDKSDPTT
jgi:hypothetical protein